MFSGNSPPCHGRVGMESTSLMRRPPFSSSEAPKTTLLPWRFAVATFGKDAQEVVREGLQKVCDEAWKKELRGELDKLLTSLSLSVCRSPRAVFSFFPFFVLFFYLLVFLVFSSFLVLSGSSRGLTCEPSDHVKVCREVERQGALNSHLSGPLPTLSELS